MAVIMFIKWWYGSGWLQMLKNTFGFIRSIAQSFSVGTLLRTLFSPWRRMVVDGGASLPAKFAAMRDNLLGRFIGFGVRLIVLVAAGLTILLALVIGLVLFLLWPFLPPAVLGLIAAGVAL